MNKTPPASDVASKIGLIDIGSNSIRLVIYRMDAGRAHRQFNARETCRLGVAVSETANLGTAEMAHSLATLERFAEIARENRADSIMAFATEAVRRARNNAIFLAAAEAVIGIPVRMLSGQEEAFFAGRGICAGFENPRGVVADLGGGSLELIAIGAGKTINPADGVSLPCGYLIPHARAVIVGFLDGVAWLESMRGQRFYAVGGVWRALALAHNHARPDAADSLHGMTMEVEELLAMLARIEGGDVAGISENRRANMAQVACITRALMEKLTPSEVVFSAFGVREGVLYDDAVLALDDDGFIALGGDGDFAGE